MAVIRVPKTPKRAFNPKRRASGLLLSQIAHLEWAVRPASERKPSQLPKIKPRTEGQAAKVIAELTSRLHPDAAPAGKKRRTTWSAKPTVKQPTAKKKPAWSAKRSAKPTAKKTR